MSAISLKSITGITSITTPAGVDNQLTLHTNDTTQRVKVTQSGIEVVGVATFQDLDVDGHTNLDNVSVAGVTTTTGNIHLNSTDKKIYLTSDYDQYITANAASNYMVFAAGNQEKVRITSAGEIKIADGGFLTIDTNPGSTYGVSEALRIDDSGTFNDRALQIFEYHHSGARSHRIQFNTNTTTNGSAYTHTQGNYGGSSAIDFHNLGDLIFFTNAQVTSGSTDSITPSERLRITSAGNLGLGMTPDTWHTNNQKVFQISGTNAGLNIFTRAGSAHLSSNFIYNSSDAGVFQAASGYAMHHAVSATNGTFDWKSSSAASSSAGSAATMVNRLRITSSGVALFGGLTSQNSEDSSKLAVQGGDSNIGIIQVHAGGGETSGDLSGIAFSHGADNQTARAKAAIASRATGAYGRGDLCFYVDGASDNNQVSAADERLRITSSGKVIVGNDGTTFGNAAVQAFIQHGNTAGESGFSSVDTTSVAAGVGGEIAFHGKYNTGAQDYAYLGHIRGIKENATAGNTACALTFHTRPNATAPQERLRITSSGNVGVNQSNPDAYHSSGQNLVIGTSGEEGITIVSGSSSNGVINFADGTGSASYIGRIIYAHSDNSMSFNTNGTEKLHISSTGELTISGTRSGNAIPDVSLKFNILDSNGNDKKATIAATKVGDISSELIFSTTASHAFAERLRIDSSGDVKVVSRGSSTSGAPFYVAVTGKSSITYAGGSDDTACLRVVDNGSTNSYYHGIELRGKRGGDVRLYCQDGGSDVADFVIATDNSGITERLRIKSTGEVHISDRNSATAGEHILQGGSFGIRMQDTGGYNRWNIERNYGGWQSTPLVHLSAQGRVGINQGSPDHTLDVIGDDSTKSIECTHGIKIVTKTDGNKRFQSGSGISYISDSLTTSDNTWYTVAILRYSSGSFTCVVGDAAVRNIMTGHFCLTNPAYGVSVFSKKESSGSWNSGSSDIQIVNSGSDIAFQVKHDSYYNDSNSAGVYLILNQCY